MGRPEPVPVRPADAAAPPFAGSHDLSLTASRVIGSSRLIPPLIFTGAFLLFVVQPLLSKYILPWFGGTPGVWTTCMLFFQCGLLAGYAYAHLLTRHLSPRGQAIAHTVLLCAAAATLPIIPSPAWRGMESQEPVRRILTILCLTVGLPYVALSATNPLLQAWTHREGRRGSPFHLYSLSNLGSFAALLSYPFAIEPFLSGRGQAWVWSALFGVFAVGCAWTAITAPGAAKEERCIETANAGPRLRDHARWILQSATGTILLLSITEYLCLEVAVVPLLWIVPLALYLLSFVVVFHGDRWYSRRSGLLGLFASASALALVQALVPASELLPLLLAWFALLFSGCMVCHGELALSRPHPESLTSFYLSSAAGGALGGVFVGVVAPRIFEAYLELPLGLFLVLVVATISMIEHAVDDRKRRASAALMAVTLVSAVALPIFIGHWVGRGAIATTRSFFGIVRVTEDSPADPMQRKRTMLNGRVIHGFQYQSAARRGRATGYYGPDSGAVLLLANHMTDRPRKIGILGMGAGTLAAYGRSGDTIRMYEINPDVVTLARRYFTFLHDSRARIEIAIGDARTVLESEPDQNFDILVVDVYSSATIPVHLFTVEAFRTYLRHLKPDGVIALHISNRHLDLSPLAFALARHFHLAARQVSGKGDPALGTFRSEYVLLSRNPASLAIDAIRRAPGVAPQRQITPWTDANNNLLEVIIW